MILLARCFLQIAIEDGRSRTVCNASVPNLDVAASADNLESADIASLIHTDAEIAAAKIDGRALNICGGIRAVVDAVVRIGDEIPVRYLAEPIASNIRQREGWPCCLAFLALAFQTFLFGCHTLSFFSRKALLFLTFSFLAGQPLPLFLQD